MDRKSGSKASKTGEPDSLSKYTDLVRFFHGPYSSIFRAKTTQPIYNRIPGGPDSKGQYQTIPTTPGSAPVHQVVLKLGLRDGLPRPHSITRELCLIRLLQGRGGPPSTNKDDGRRRIICALSSFLTESKDTQAIYLAIVEPFYQQGDLGSWLKLQRQRSIEPDTARLEDRAITGGLVPLLGSASSSSSVRRPVKTRQPLLRHALTRCVIRDITRALGWVHSLGVIHRDVKPQNILLAYNIDSLNDYYTTTPKQLEVFDHIPLAILTDFGISWRAEDCPEEAASSKLLDVGTRAYRAPELLFAWSSYGTELDIWSLACVMAELYMIEGDQDTARDPNPNKDISCRREEEEQQQQQQGRYEDEEVFYDQEDGSGISSNDRQMGGPAARGSIEKRAKVRAEMFGLSKPPPARKPPPIKMCTTFFNDGDGGPGSDFCLINSIFKKLGTPSFEFNKAIETAGSKWHEANDGKDKATTPPSLPPTFWPDASEFTSFKYFDFHSYVRQSMGNLLPAAPQAARDLLDKWFVYQATNRMSMLEALSSDYLRLNGD